MAIETVAELIELLQDMPQDAPIKFASQPSWPFEYSIGEVYHHAAPDTMDHATFEALDDDAQERAEEQADEGRLVFLNEGEDAPVDVVFLVEGSQLGYLTEGVSRNIGWR